MTDGHDPILQDLFAEAHEELDGAAFTAQLMTRTRVALVRRAAGWLCAAVLVVVAAGLFVAPVQELAALLSQALTTALVDLGDSWWALVISPINSVASVLVLTVKIARMSLGRIRSASYA